MQLRFPDSVIHLAETSAAPIMHWLLCCDAKGKTSMKRMSMLTAIAAFLAMAAEGAEAQHPGSASAGMSACAGSVTPAEQALPRPALQSGEKPGSGAQLQPAPGNKFSAQLNLTNPSQLDPRVILVVADKSLQEGDVGVFGSQVSQIIFMQTGGTGIYQPIRQLGPLTNVALAGTLQMPAGIMLQGRTFHQKGYIDWTLGFSYMTRKIEIAYFNPLVGSWPQKQAPGTTPKAPAPTATTGGPSTTPAVPASKDDACTKYPTLCS